MNYTTTLAQIRRHDPCASGWRKLITHLGADYPEDKPISLATILKSNGWRDAVWALRSVNEVDRDARLFACDCAELVLPKFEARYPEDRRPRQAIEVARRFADGLATPEESQAAAAASAAAAYYAAAADYAAYAAAYAAYDAAYAAYYAAAYYAAYYAAAADYAADYAADAVEKLFTERFCK